MPTHSRPPALSSPAHAWPPDPSRASGTVRRTTSSRQASSPPPTLAVQISVRGPARASPPWGKDCWRIRRLVTSVRTNPPRMTKLRSYLPGSAFRFSAFGNKLLAYSTAGSRFSALGNKLLAYSTAGSRFSALGNKLLAYSTAGSRFSALGNKLLAYSTAVFRN